jgi:hypothetical protein
MQVIAHDTGLSRLNSISKNSPRHNLLISIGAMGTFPFKTVIGCDSCSILPVVEASSFDPIVNISLEDLVAFDLVFVAMVGGDGDGERTL